MNMKCRLAKQSDALGHVLGRAGRGHQRGAAGGPAHARRLVVFDNEGDRQFVGFGGPNGSFADAVISAEQLPMDVLRSASALVTGTLGLNFPPLQRPCTRRSMRPRAARLWCERCHACGASDPLPMQALSCEECPIQESHSWSGETVSALSAGAALAASEQDVCQLYRCLQAGAH